MLAPHPTRLRSKSNPARPRLPRPQSDTNPNPNPRSSYHDLSATDVPPDPSPPILTVARSPQMKPKPLSFFPSPLPMMGRKLFRSKRPSSSSAALQSTYERGTLSQPTQAPPRPPRNPARRPSKSRGTSIPNFPDPGKSQSVPALPTQIVTLPAVNAESATFPLLVGVHRS